MTVFAEGVDYSAGRPSLAAMRAAGKSFVVRYVSAGQHAKEITAEEARYWSSVGINICIVYESTAGRALDGRPAGIVDARSARDDVVAAGGPADGGVVYFAVDIDTTTATQLARISDYLAGAASVLGRNNVGVYGEWDVINSLAVPGSPCTRFWQTYAWSGGRLHQAAQLYQYKNGQTLGGVEVDLDRAYAPDYGQWNPTAGDEMSAEGEKKILDALADLKKGLNLALYGDDRDDKKDANTHPENLQAIKKVVDGIATAVKALPTGSVTIGGPVTTTASGTITLTPKKE